MTGPLDTLFAGRTAQTAETAAPSGDAPDLGALAEKLVERILVSGPDGGHEIRLTLGKDVLPGTEIRLQRGSDGVLSVHLATDNAASFQTLVGAQESLKARLESFEKDVRVEVVSERGGPKPRTAMGVGSRAASMSLRTNGMPDPGARGGMPRQPFEVAQPETFCNSPPLPEAEKYMEILPFRAPALSPLEAHVFNLLCTRAQPWPIDVAGTPCALEAGGLAAPVPPVCAFDVVCGERTWRVELAACACWLCIRQWRMCRRTPHCPGRCSWRFSTCWPLLWRNWRKRFCMCRWLSATSG